MSELTQCNWDTLQDFMRTYGVQNIVLMPDGDWISVMRFAPAAERLVTEMDFALVGTNDDWQHIASFKQLTTTCVC